MSNATDRETINLSAGGDAKVAPVVSDGSVRGTTYSGCDIKAVVHLSPPLTAMQEILMPEMEAIERRLQVLVDWIRDPDTRGEDKITFQKTANNLRRELQRLRAEYKEFGKPVTKVLAELQTISLSVHREKFPVRALGTNYPKSHTRGPRTIGGSFIFAVFYEHVFRELMGQVLPYYSTGVAKRSGYPEYSTALPDQIPAFDITAVFANEAGHLSQMNIYGIELINEGLVMSVQDLYLENTFTYTARDYDPMREIGKPIIGTTGLDRPSGFSGRTGGDLLKHDEAMALLRSRRNPYY